MRYIKRIGILFSAIILLMTAMVINSDAQRRARFVSSGSRPIIVRSFGFGHPFWYSRYYDPFYDPYFYDPYLRAQREKYYREEAVRDARKKVNKDQQKYASDGYLTPEEREKMAKNQRKYREAVQKLNDYYRNS